jgi:hypothetical protein
LEKNADLIKAVMAQRKKKPKPVPAIIGGEAIIEPTAITENGTKGATEPVTTTNQGDTVGPPQSTTNGHKDATDLEMNGADNDLAAVPVNADNTGHEVSISTNQPISNGAQECVDQDMVVDTDNTDTALVEDTI